MSKHKKISRIFIPTICCSLIGKFSIQKERKKWKEGIWWFWFFYNCLFSTNIFMLYDAGFIICRNGFLYRLETGLRAFSGSTCCFLTKHNYFNIFHSIHQKLITYFPFFKTIRWPHLVECFSEGSGDIIRCLGSSRRCMPTLFALSASLWNWAAELILRQHSWL